MQTSCSGSLHENLLTNSTVAKRVSLAQAVLRFLQSDVQGLAEGYDITAISDHSNLDTGTQCGCAAAAPHLPDGRQDTV